MKHLPAVAALCELEFVFVTGKGGVGKSTAAEVLALHAANRGKNALIVYPADASGAKKLWSQALHHTPRTVAPQVDAVLINPETAMREYIGSLLKSRKLASLLFHSKVAHGLLTGIPGPSDWAILGRAWAWTHSGTYQLPKGQKRYDLVIVDAPASGDGTGMLRVPQVILDVAPSARFRTDAESCLRSLRDVKKSAIVFVALAEEMVVTETEENIVLVREELRMPLGPLFINQLQARLFSSKDRQILLNLITSESPPKTNLVASESPPKTNLVASESPPKTNLVQANSAESPPKTNLVQANSAVKSYDLLVAAHYAKKEELQLKYVKRLASLGLPMVSIPQFGEDMTQFSAIKKLEKGLAECP